MMRVATTSIEELSERDTEEGLPDRDAGPAKLDHWEADCSAGTRPNGVWFGPKGSEATERQLISFLGSHHGVAVLQWPRDIGRSHQLRSLGIPRLWFVHDGAALPVARDKSEEWIHQTASDLEIHESLRRLCDWAAREHSGIARRPVSEIWRNK
jgi:hypothetical protein